MTSGLLDPPGTRDGTAPDGEESGAPGATDGATDGTGSPGGAGQRLWRSVRLPVLVLGLLVAVLVAGVLVTERGRSGYLDPDATDPGGTRALAVLLAQGGVPLERVTSTDEAVTAGGSATVAVPFPGQLVDRSRRLLAESDLDLVVLGPGDDALADFAPGLAVASATGSSPRSPGCPLPAATTAGVVGLGGLTYDTAEVDTAGADDAAGAGAVACYDAAGGALLVQLERASGGTTTVLGSGDLLTNDQLDEEGNAALGLLLLGGGDEVRWLMPAPGTEAPEEDESLFGLLPGAVQYALLQLVLAGVLLALWQARRLGPVVTEPLPVVVRAAETVEGRARLYRAARARDRAADQLRRATRSRLAAGVGAGSDPAPAALVPAVASRAALAEDEVGTLLYGPVPPDDRALVRLADDLDRLESRLLPRARPAPDDGGRP
jgi:hypothetical protein